MSFGYSDFLTVSRLAVGAEAAILRCGAGNNVLLVSERSRIANIKGFPTQCSKCPLPLFVKVSYEQLTESLFSE